MACQTMVSTLGILLEIIGFVTWLRYPMPSSIFVEDEGTTFEITWSEITENRRATFSKHKMFNHVGLILAVTGLVLQLVSNFTR